jgi:hypothetical protein
MDAGRAGKVVTLESVLALLLPQILVALTVILPVPVPVKLTLMDVVFCPLAMVANAGTVHK